MEEYINGGIFQQKANTLLALQENPILLFLYAVMFFALLAVTLVWKQPQILNFFKKEGGGKPKPKKVKLENVMIMLEEDKLDRIKRQEENDKRLDAIEANISVLSAVVADHERFTKTLSRGTLKSILFNENFSAFERLKAFRRLVAKGENGRVYKVGFEIILHNQEDWLNVLDIELDEPIADEKYFKYIMGDIKNRIFEGFM